MVIVGTKIKSSDNSGIRLLNCIKILGPHKNKAGSIGDKIIVSIRKAISTSRIKKNEVHDAVIVRTKKVFFRKLGTIISFQYNAVVVIDKKKNVPIATRLYGPILYEMRRKRFLKILAIAHTIL